MSQNGRIAFLLGSGVSLGSGAPTVGSLTESILEGNWKEHTDQHFYPGDELDVSGGRALTIQRFLNVLEAEIAGHLRDREARKPNYEDFYTALTTLFEDEAGDLVNPMIRMNSDSLRRASAHLWDTFPYHVDRNRFASLMDRSLTFIQDVIRVRLQEVDSPQGFSLLSEIGRTWNEVDIYSLNHDLLIEEHFKETGTQSLIDGFSRPEGNVMIFEDWNGPGKFRLFKLHGSVDWYHFEFKRLGFVQYAKVSSHPDGAVDNDDKSLDLAQIGASFLSGVTVKERSYDKGIFDPLFREFRSRLASTNLLVASGYGWCDDGINFKVNQWLHDARENHLVILDENRGQSIARTKFWSAFVNLKKPRLQTYEEAGRVTVIPKWLSDTTVEDILEVTRRVA